MVKKVIVSLLLMAVLITVFCAFSVLPVDTDQADPNVTVMYSKDGRTIEVPNDEVEAYKKVNWYENFSDVITTVWAEDGRTNIVYQADEAAYLDVGWYPSRDDVVTTVYRGEAGSEESKEIFKSETEKYVAEGWKRSKHNVDPDKPMVALTFDDGPKPSTTNRILDALEKYGGRATFYMLGNRVSAGADCVKRMQELGCEIASHTYDHTQLTKLSQDAIKEELEKANNCLRDAAGQNAESLRPPYGSYNDDVKAAADVPIVLWSIDTLDWKTRNADSVYEEVVSKVKDGDIILMHDIYESSADAAVRLIPALQDMGFQLVTFTELGEARGGIHAGEVYTDFRKATVEKKQQQKEEKADTGKAEAAEEKDGSTSQESQESSGTSSGDSDTQQDNNSKSMQKL